MPPASTQAAEVLYPTLSAFHAVQGHALDFIVCLYGNLTFAVPSRFSKSTTAWSRSSRENGEPPYQKSFEIDL